MPPPFPPAPWLVRKHHSGETSPNDEDSRAARCLGAVGLWGVCCRPEKTDDSEENEAEVFLPQRSTFFSTYKTEERLAVIEEDVEGSSVVGEEKTNENDGEVVENLRKSEDSEWREREKSEEFSLRDGEKSASRSGRLPTFGSLSSSVSFFKDADPSSSRKISSLESMSVEKAKDESVDEKEIKTLLLPSEETKKSTEQKETLPSRAVPLESPQESSGWLAEEPELLNLERVASESSPPSMPLSPGVVSGVSPKSQKLTELKKRHEVELQYFESKFAEVHKLNLAERLLAAKVQLDSTVREAKRRIARTMFVEDSEVKEERQHVKKLQKLVDKVECDKAIMQLNIRFEILTSTFAFFHVDHLVENFARNPSVSLSEDPQSDFLPNSHTEATETPRGGHYRSGAKKQRLSFIGRSFSGRFRKDKKKGGKDKGGDEGGWNAENDKGMELKYKLEKEGSVSVTVKAKLRNELFQVLAILAETDYFKKWVPYCETVIKFHDLTRASFLCSMTSNYPFPINRKESIMYCFGVDALDECGCVIVCIRSPPLKEKEFLDVALPDPPHGVTRVPCNHMCFLLFPIENGKATILEVYANVDPGVNLGGLVKRLIAWLVKRIVKGFYVRILDLCHKFKGSDIEQRIPLRPELYEWIRGRIEEYFHQPHVFGLESSMLTMKMEDFKEYL